MNKIKGIYAAAVSILNENLSLNIDRTVLHAENLIDQGCHGVAIFGSTGQGQLISVSEKINLLTLLSTSKYKNNYLIGTGFNSLSETINMMKEAGITGKKNGLGRHLPIKIELWKREVKPIKSIQPMEENDIIVEVNREQIIDASQFKDKISEIKLTGRTSILLRVIRENKNIWVTLKYL